MAIIGGQGTPKKKTTVSPYAVKNGKQIGTGKKIKVASAPKPKASKITRGALSIKERMPKSRTAKKVRY